MRSNFIALWATVAQLAMTKAQVPQAECPSDSIYCCIINFSDTECGQAGAEIDYSVSIPTAADQLPVVNLPEPLTVAAVVECNLDHPELVLCSEKDCTGGQQWRGAGTRRCVNPGFFIQSAQVAYG